MRLKRQRQHLKAARTASIESFKNRKLEASSLPKSAQPQIDDDKLSTDDTSDTEGESGIWFWNESANEIDSDSEEEGELDEKDWEEEQSSTQQDVSCISSKVEIKWNKEGEQNLRGGYGKGSKRTQMRHNKSVRDLEKEASKTYNIEALWQRSRDLGMISKANNQVGLEQSTELQPNNSVSPIPSLSDVPPGCTPFSKEQIHDNQQVKALEDLNRLLKLVTEQEKQYGDRLSPHSNFYRRHLMVQQFLHTQLQTQSSSTRRAMALTVAQSFGRGMFTARNIVRWEKSWVSIREIPERKERDDGDSWMYDEDVNDAIKKFVRIQGDRKYYLI